MGLVVHLVTCHAVGCGMVHGLVWCCGCLYDVYSVFYCVGVVLCGLVSFGLSVAVWCAVCVVLSFLVWSCV